jgi:hypothetical protein
MKAFGRLLEETTAKTIMVPPLPVAAVAEPDLALQLRLRAKMACAAEWNRKVA